MSETLLEVRDLKKYFPIRKGLLRRVAGQVRAVDGVSFMVRKGETLALVGESGCGKTTVSRCILRALSTTEGEINFTIGGKTVDLAKMTRAQLRPLRRHMQMVFQDPYSSLNPRMVVGDIIGEPLLINGMSNRAERRRRVLELMELVQLPAAYINRFPHAFSGGQRQRIGIARALALNPELIVADEPVSALDVSVQAQILNLLLDLQDRLRLTILFVAHDLSVVKHVADRVAVMYVGRMVEVAETEALYSRPLHPYTEALLSAAPAPVPDAISNRIILEREIADPANPPPGCAFHPRCRYATERCKQERPEMAEVEPGRYVACLRWDELSLRGIAAMT
ncbi:MAG: dipeptide ABC transporter ATP-binding protein [Alphaproteobacteria bacterium]|nr:dipeptide ABC transporter ATP-binding protein [Alphaproteobacteria bacterium]